MTKLDIKQELMLEWNFLKNPIMFLVAITLIGLAISFSDNVLTLFFVPIVTGLSGLVFILAILNFQKVKLFLLVSAICFGLNIFITANTIPFYTEVVIILPFVMIPVILLINFLKSFKSK